MVEEDRRKRENRIAKPTFRNPSKLGAKQDQYWFFVGDSSSKALSLATVENHYNNPK